jgi:hypothetical protein
LIRSKPGSGLLRSTNKEGWDEIPSLFVCIRNFHKETALKIQRYLIVFTALLFLAGCAPALQKAPQKVGSLDLSDISNGLPQNGEWRQNVALADMNGDGFLDIVAPPSRKIEEGKNIPHIFLWDQKEKRWKEGAFTFPSLKDYGYGGIAVGDINGDGYPDIVLAVHEKRIILLENDKNNGFIEKPFPVKDTFHSRMVDISDINGDGRADIIAFSEAPFRAPDRNAKGRLGILVGLNKGTDDWDVKVVEGSSELFGDSVAVGDINGDGNKDIAIAPLMYDETRAKLIWFADGKSNFTLYDGDVISNKVQSYFVRLGDVDGDGKDAVIFNVAGFGAESKFSLCAYKWTGAGFADISKGLEMIDYPIVFDLADIDGDGRKELVVLSKEGIGIYKHRDKGWDKLGYYPLPFAAVGASDLRVGRNRDGSFLIVYNQGSMGSTDPALDRGIRAYLMKRVISDRMEIK